MPSIRSLAAKLRTDYPALVFQESDIFEWSPPTKTISYDPHDSLATSRLLHELGHAKLQHTAYNRDIELIAHERDAWRHAKTILAPTYNVVIKDETIEDDMDTYRDWMHARSTCPHCGANGIQTDTRTYRCAVCRRTWQVNDARQNRLYRRLLPTRK